MTGSAGNYTIQMEADPPAQQSRWWVLLRIFLVLPHVVVLVFLSIAQLVITIIAWFAILIVGRYPAGMLRFSTGVLHWAIRASAATASSSQTSTRPSTWSRKAAIRSGSRSPSSSRAGAG